MHVRQSGRRAQSLAINRSSQPDAAGHLLASDVSVSVPLRVGLRAVLAPHRYHDNCLLVTDRMDASVLLSPLRSCHDCKPLSTRRWPQTYKCPEGGPIALEATQPQKRRGTASDPVSRSLAASMAGDYRIFLSLSLLRGTGRYSSPQRREMIPCPRAASPRLPSPIRGDGHLSVGR